MTFTYKNYPVVGEPDSFMTVRHLYIKGTNFEIGRQLAILARDELSVRKMAWTDPLMTRAQKKFMEQNWPAHFARMQAAADVFGCDLDDDSIDFSFLAYDWGVPGCSCVFYPAASTMDGHNILSRNFDFTTSNHVDFPIGFSTIDVPIDAKSAAAKRPYAGRPFVMETHPDGGYATLGMCAFDLLGSLTDGMNSEGLAVALLNDSETMSGASFEPFGKNGVGLNETQVPRFLLENCADVEEAIIALLTTKQYYINGPCHYLVCDRSGRAFVWEYSSVRNKHHIMDCGDKPLAVTNHLLHSKVSGDLEILENSVGRLSRLNEMINRTDGRFTRDRIREINKCVEATDSIGRGQYVSATHPARTLWYGFYDLDALTVEFNYYLNDNNGISRQPLNHFFHLDTDGLTGSKRSVDRT